MSKNKLNNYIPLSVIGISHKTAPVEVRERAALNEDEQRRASIEIVKRFDIDGCLIISTCNRTEIYISGENAKNQTPAVCAWLDAYKGCNYFSDTQITYRLSGLEAVHHFFKVISGLDSQIVGEPQITGQVKDSYNLAHQSKTTDTLLNKLFNFGLQAEKKVRTATFLSDGAVSVSFAGVELARKIFSDLKDKTALLIGAGETAELAAVHFKEKGVREMLIANRTLDKARKLADKFGGKAYHLSDLASALMQADIIISATSGKNYVVTKDILAPVCEQRAGQPLFFIDLAIPRDIDPAADRFNDVYLYNLDNLQEIVQMNLEKRKLEIPRALKIIDEYIDDFQKWVSSHAVSFVIKRLKDHFDQLRIKELERLKNRLPNDGIKEVEYLTQSILNKIMHQHIKSLKKSVSDPELYQRHVDFIFNLYELDDK